MTTEKKRRSKKKATTKVAKAKTVKTVKKAKKPEFSLADIVGELKDFQIDVMNEDTKFEEAPYRIPFRHKGLQKITGGIIGGKFAEISGMSQAGKSFLFYELASEAQKMGGFALLFDGERAFETAYADIVGLDMKAGTFSVSYEVDIDKLFNMSIKLIKAIRKKKKKLSVPILIGVDSFPTLQTKTDLENMEAGKDPRGYLAMQKNAKFSDNMSRMVGVLDKYGATFVLLNQLTKDYNVSFGDPWRSNAEEKIKFWATQRLRGKLMGKLVSKKNKGVQTGMKSSWKTIKNRAVKPFQEVITYIRYAKGINPTQGLADVLLNDFCIKDATTTQVREGLTETMNPKLFKENDKGETVFKKPHKGFKVYDTKLGDDNFYYTVEEIIEAHPEFMTPVWTGSYDDGEDFEEEVGSDDE